MIHSKCVYVTIRSSYVELKWVLKPLYFALGHVVCPFHEWFIHWRCVYQKTVNCIVLHWMTLVWSHLTSLYGLHVGIINVDRVSWSVWLR